MPDIAICAQQLTKKYADRTVVDRFDLTVASGIVLSLLGPNGAGKTTIVRMLTTLARPTSGTATVFGRDIRTQPDAVRLVTSLTGQFAALEDNLTAQENLLLMARLRGYGPAAARRMAGQLADRLDLGPFRGQVVKSLSGGQRRRVDLAASLVARPRLLVLDEPTTGLDPRSRQAVWAAVRALVADEITVLLTTQYLEEADALADRIVLIDGGLVTASGTSGELKSRIGTQRVDITAADDGSYTRLHAALAARFPVTAVPERRSLSVPAPRGPDDLAAVTALVQAAGTAVEQVALRRPSLDDAFLALTATSPASPGETA